MRRLAAVKEVVAPWRAMQADAQALGELTALGIQEGDEELASKATEALTLPPVQELWSPFLYLVPLQLLTYYLALAKGCQPDLFRRDEPVFAAAHSHYTL